MGCACMVVAVAMLQALMPNSAVITFANGMGLSLLALSLVLLTGYAGEINLAAYTFAGIAADRGLAVRRRPGGNATADFAVGRRDHARRSPSVPLSAR